MYRLLKRVVISGHPGTGTTTLIEKLGQLYKLKPEQKIKVGDLFRQASIEKTGHDITGYYPREITEDLSIDNMQKQLLSDPNPDLIFILESRLGSFFTTEIGHPPTIVTILITTEEPVRLKRIFERDKQSLQSGDLKQSLQSNDLKPNLTFDQYSQKVKERQEKDFKQWQEAYPQMSSNPLDNPNLYDFHIDNTNLDIDQTIQEVNKKLIKLGAVEEVS